MSESATTIATPIQFEQSDALRFLPEGPMDLGAGRVSWVSIQHGADSKVGSINELDIAAGKNQSFELPGRPGFAFASDRPGVYVAGVERELGHFDTATRTWTAFATGIDSDVDNTIVNDAVMHRDNIIFGTKDLEFKTRKAGLYLYRGRDSKLIRLRADQLCSNGKAIVSGDENQVTFLDIDSPTKTIVRYELDIAAGTLSDPQTVVDLTSGDGVPDGQILTPDGKSLIVAIFNGDPVDHGETRMYDIASGTLQHTWTTPGSPQNTCPALVNIGGKTRLLMTTAVENFAADALAKCAQAGRLFLADVPF